MPEEFFASNHKELAAILADSGNPIRSSEPYTPVVPSRGLPPDLSGELTNWLQGESSDTTTWFTAREATEFGWEERIMRRRAMVPREAAGLFAGCPRGFPFAGWPDGLQVSYSTWHRDGVTVDWLESYAEIVPDFVRDVLPRLAAMGSPDQVRLVVVVSW